MLIEFRVENHRSLRDEQVLTMEASHAGDPDDARPRAVAGHTEKLLPLAGIYGANASGKTNVLSAIAYVREAVLFSHRLWQPDGGITRLPFAWGDQRRASSMYETTFLLDGAKYQYGFVIDDERIVEEWLSAWPKRRRRNWFSRDNQDFKFSEHLKGPNETITNVTRPNALFLSVAAQNNHKQLVPIYHWFREIAVDNVDVNAFYPEQLLLARWAVNGQIFHDRHESTQRALHEDTAGKLVKDVFELMSKADVGISDIKTEKAEDLFGKNYAPRYRVSFQHQPNDEDSWLTLNEESAGTRRLFRLALPMLQTLASGGLLIVDELESSLHPLLGLEIIRTFNDPATNPKNAQILFTTHDTNLLSTLLGEAPLRRDQIWFTEKDGEGTTKLYPLTDYKPRKSENLERGYVQGRYGAIPFLGELSTTRE